MTPALDTPDLEDKSIRGVANTENELVQAVVRETVRAAMETSLRKPILEAVEVTTEAGEEIREETSEAGTERGTSDEGTPLRTKAVQWLAVFAVLFGAVYVALRQLTGEGTGE